MPFRYFCHEMVVLFTFSVPNRPFLTENVRCPMGPLGIQQTGFSR
jgi:hypothetical protein